MPKKASSRSNSLNAADESGSSSPSSIFYFHNNSDNGVGVGGAPKEANFQQQTLHVNPSPPKYEKAGWLYKWTNYVKGYRKRWFLLDSVGNLNYYRDRSSEADGNFRGKIYLAEASIHANSNDGNNLVISAPSSQTFHLKAANDLERNSWVRALECAKYRAIRQASTLEEEEEESQLFLAKTEDLRKLPMANLEAKADSLREKCTKFKKDLDEFSHYAIGHSSAGEAKKLGEKAKPLKQLNESIAENTQELLSKHRHEYEALLRLANSQNEKYRELQKQYEILAHQHSHLERDAFNSIKKTSAAAAKQKDANKGSGGGGGIAHSVGKPLNTPYGADESEEEEEEGQQEEGEEETFHDASDNLILEEAKKRQTTTKGGGRGSGTLEEEKKSIGEEEAMGQRNSLAAGGGGPGQLAPASSAPSSPTAASSGGGKFELSKCTMQIPQELADYEENTQQTVVPSADGKQPKIKRSSIPPKPESHGISLWSIMRNCIGKELTRIPIPVNFNEPLSMLQRITEDLEYSYLLDRAAEKEDMCERLAYVAAFAVSCYSATAKRTTKPFNPLLGETFEFDRRDDLGWRSLVEQVSHHPPAAAHHVDGVNWALHQEFMVSSRFRGKYMSVLPTGYTHVEFRDGRAQCTFQKVTTTVHNIIVGRLWIDNHGEMTIINHVGGERALLKFQSYSYFSTNRPRKVEGVVLNAGGEPRFCIEGYWDSHINIAPVTGQRREEKGGRMALQTSRPRRIWKANQPFANSTMFNFTRLAIEMNEPDESVAPTDSRRRPDQRLMEQGKWEEANKRKNQLEERQRRARRQAEADAERAINNNQQPDEYHARWFKKVQDANIGSVIHVVRDEEYWRCKKSGDWSRCPEIFS